MKSEKATWHWQGQRLAPLLLAVLMVSCAPQAIEIPAGTVADNSSQVQQVPTLQSGFEIPAPNDSQPLCTDLDVPIPGGGIPYREPLEETKINIGSGPTAPSVRYRSYINTIAGEVHCNMVAVCEQDLKNLCQAAFSQCDLRITNKLDKIQFYFIKAGWAGPGPCAYCHQSVLVIDIAQDISLGDYKTDILVFLDGKYFTTLPCTIHVNP